MTAHRLNRFLNGRLGRIQRPDLIAAADNKLAQQIRVDLAARRLLVPRRGAGAAMPMRCMSVVAPAYGYALARELVAQNASAHRSASAVSSILLGNGSCPIRTARRRDSCRSSRDTKRRSHRDLLMHSSLAVTTEGLPLGLTAVKFWSRKKFKGTAALKKKINPTAFPSRRRKAFGGWTMSGNPQSCWVIRNDASMWVIARATSISCSAPLEKLERIS